MNIEEFTRRLEKLTARLQGMDAGEPEFLMLRDEILKLREALSSFGTVSRSDLENRFQGLQNAWNGYQAVPATRATEEMREELYSLCGEDTVKPVKKFLYRTMELADREADPSVDTGSLKVRGGKSITFSEGVTSVPGFAKKSPEELAGKILFVGENLALFSKKCERDGKDYEEELAKLDQKPVDEYANLMAYLGDAGQDKRMQVALLLSQREQELLGKIGRTVETLQKRVLPERGTDGQFTVEELENAQRRVNEDLVLDKSFRDLEAFVALKERLSNSPLATELKLITDRKHGPDAKSFLDDTVRSISGTESGKKALEKAVEKDEDALRTSGLVQKENLFALKASDLLGRMTRYGKDGSSWNSIARQLYYLRTEDFSDLTSKKLEKQAYACLTAAEVYLHDHKRTLTEKGKYRKLLAAEIRDHAGEVLGKIREVRAKQNISAEEAETLKEKQEKSAEELVKLARYQSNVGTCKIKTEPPSRMTMELVQEGNDSLRAGIGHGIYSCLKLTNQAGLGLIGNAAGAILWLKNKKKIKESLASAQDYDAEHVPGMREDRYREPEAGEIITDKRRIPLVWEKPIPGDPDQPSTLTFEVDQPFEGQDYTANGDYKNVGHTFLTLRYTKKNPFTGEKQRYQTSFGFYPRNMPGKFEGGVQSMGQVTLGVPQTGKIKNDNGHTVCAGATVEITTEQFNDIIRFTGEYEKGGYNSITRNCTTFAVEAVKHAGIRMPEISGVRPTEFVRKGISYKTAGYFTGDMLAGVLLERELVKSKTADQTQQKETSQYSRLGQNVASKQDLEHVLDGTFNKRLRGYNPGQAGEGIRGSYGFQLHSKRYQGNEKARKRAFDQLTEAEKEGYEGNTTPKKLDINNFVKIKSRSRYLFALMRGEIPRLRRKIEGVYGKRNAELRTVLDNIETFQNTSIEALEKIAENGFSNQGSVCEQRRNQLKAFENGVRQIDGYVDQMNQIYRDVFHADSRVNLPFQHTVSLAEYLKETFETAYQKAYVPEPHLKDRAADISFRNRKSWYEMSKDLYSGSLDMAETMWQTNQVMHNYPISHADLGLRSYYSMRPSELLATMLAFEDPKEAIRQLAFHEENPKAAEMTALKNTMVKALETWQDGHEYSAEELKAVFLRLPELEKDLALYNVPASSLYQAFAFYGILGNGALGTDLDQRFAELVEEKRAELTPPDDAALLYETIQRKQNRQTELYDRYREEDLSPEETQELNNLTGEIGLLQRDFKERVLPMQEALSTVIEQFTKETRDRLENALNRLPEAKKRKLEQIAGILQKDLEEKKEEEKGRELTEEEKTACRTEARKLTGERLVETYLKGICRKAIKGMHEIDGPDWMVQDALTICEQDFLNKAAAWNPGFFRENGAHPVIEEEIPDEEDLITNIERTAERKILEKGKRKEDVYTKFDVDSDSDDGNPELDEESLITNIGKKAAEPEEEEIEIRKKPAKSGTTEKKEEEKEPEEEDESLIHSFAENEKLLSSDMEYAKKPGRNRFFFSKEDPSKNKWTPEELAGQILWFGENYFLADRLKKEKETSARMSISSADELVTVENTDLFGNVLKELEAAGETENMKYAMLFAARQRQLVRKVKEEEEKIRSRFDPEEEEFFGETDFLVAEELVKRKSFRELKSFLALKEHLKEYPFLFNPLKFAMKKAGMEEELPDIQKIEERLRKTEQGRKALSEALEKDLDDLYASGLPVNKYARDSFLLLRKLGKLEDQSGTSWQEITNKLSLLQTTDPHPYSPLYRQRLRDCFTAADDYLKSHKSFSFTSKGATRKGVARDVRSLMEEMLKDDPYCGIVTVGKHSEEELGVPENRCGLKTMGTSVLRASSGVIGYLRGKYPAMASMSAAEMSRTEEYRTAFAEFKEFLLQNAIYDDKGKLLENGKVFSGFENLAQYASQWIKAIREKRTFDLFNPETRRERASELPGQTQELIDCIQITDKLPSINLKNDRNQTNGQKRPEFYFDHYPTEKYREDLVFLLNYSKLVKMAKDLDDPEANFQDRMIARIVLDRCAEEAAGKSMEEFCISEKASECLRYKGALDFVIGGELRNTEDPADDNYIRNGGKMPEYLTELLESKAAKIQDSMEAFNVKDSSETNIERYKEIKKTAGKETVSLTQLEEEDKKEDKKEENKPAKDPMRFMEEWKKSDPKVVYGEKKTGNTKRINISELEEREQEKAFAEEFGMLETTEEKTRELQEAARRRRNHHH